METLLLRVVSEVYYVIQDSFNHIYVCIYNGVMSMFIKAKDKKNYL